MQDDHSSPELSQQEQEAFRSLSRDHRPPPALEDQVVAALKDRGLVRLPQAGWWRTLPRFAAAAMLVLAVGFAAGRWTAASLPSESVAPRFMLLLYDTPEREAGRSPETNQALAAEYGAWAGEIARDGHFLAGDPIHGEGRMLRQVGQRVERFPATETGEEMVVGYFMIQADDYDQALKIAEGCPHLKYQGGVLVRRVGET